MTGAALTIPSPIGALTLCEDAGAIVRIDWEDSGRVDDTPLLIEAARQLEAYFSGRRSAFDLPVRYRGSALEEAVWDAMCAIPFGETRTYGDMASAIATAGTPADPRLVGRACGANPIAVVVPCHRVTGAGGTLVGYSGGAGVETKRWLLQHEGALLI